MLIFESRVSEELPKVKFLINQDGLLFSVSAIEKLSPEIKALTLGRRKPFCIIKNSTKFKSLGRFMGIDGLEHIIQILSKREINATKMIIFRDFYLGLCQYIKEVPTDSRKPIGVVKGNSLLHPRFSQSGEQKLLALLTKKLGYFKLIAGPGKDKLPYGY
jgi:hypothetical protein